MLLHIVETQLLEQIAWTVASSIMPIDLDSILISSWGEGTGDIDKRYCCALVKLEYICVY